MNGFSVFWMKGFVKAWVLVWNQSWIFNGKADAEAETPVLWLPDAKSWLIWKDSGIGKDWRREEKGTTEDEMVRWVWVNSGSWWWTGRPGLLQSMGSQRVKHDWATELDWVLVWGPRTYWLSLNRVLSSMCAGCHWWLYTVSQSLDNAVYSASLILLYIWWKLPLEDGGDVWIIPISLFQVGLDFILVKITISLNETSL